MRVFVTGGTGHSGSFVIPELIAAGHEVTGLARSDTAAAALTALGATVRRGSLEDLDRRGVRSSVVRIANIAHGTTDRAGFLPLLIALAKEKGVAGYPGDDTNLWNAVHARDLASLFRLALEEAPAGSYWHAVEDGGIPFRTIAEAIGSRLELPVVSIPADELMTPGYFGFLANIATQSYPASNLITRRSLGWRWSTRPPARRRSHLAQEPTSVADDGRGALPGARRKDLRRRRLPQGHPGRCRPRRERLTRVTTNDRREPRMTTPGFTESGNVGMSAGVTASHFAAGAAPAGARAVAVRRSDDG